MKHWSMVRSHCHAKRPQYAMWRVAQGALARTWDSGDNGSSECPPAPAHRHACLKWRGVPACRACVLCEPCQTCTPRVPCGQDPCPALVHVDSRSDRDTNRTPHEKLSGGECGLLLTCMCCVRYMRVADHGRRGRRVHASACTATRVRLGCRITSLPVSTEKCGPFEPKSPDLWGTPCRPFAMISSHARSRKCCLGLLASSSLEMLTEGRGAPVGAETTEIGSDVYWLISFNINSARANISADIPIHCHSVPFGDG